MLFPSKNSIIGVTNEKLHDSKEALLSLYNAVNQTSYSDEQKLTIRTPDDCLYLGYKNDVSFLINDFLNLYEHQSTFCRNMPMRGLIYFGSMYKAYIADHNLNIYGDKLLELPTPRFIVFYNGESPIEDKVVLRLSDSFLQEDACIEVKATMYNINFGHNRELMESCRLLNEYSIFIATVRKHLKSGYPRDIAVNLAVDECIESNILQDFLIKHRSEVVDMFLVDYKPELQRKFDREEGFNEGKSIGIAEGEYLCLISQIKKKIQKAKSLEQIADELEDSPAKIRLFYKLILENPDKESSEIFALYQQQSSK